MIPASDAVTCKQDREWCENYPIIKENLSTYLHELIRQNKEQEFQRVLKLYKHDTVLNGAAIYLRDQ
jgi:hypothetical protein